MGSARTAGGAHSASPDPLAVFGGRGAPLPPGKGRGMGRGKKRGRGEGKGKREGREMGKRGRGGEGRECALPIFTGAPHFLIPGVAHGISYV